MTGYNLVNVQPAPCLAGNKKTEAKKAERGIKKMFEKINFKIVPKEMWKEELCWWGDVYYKLEKLAEYKRKDPKHDVSYQSNEIYNKFYDKPNWSGLDKYNPVPTIGEGNSFEKTVNVYKETGVPHGLVLYHLHMQQPALAMQYADEMYDILKEYDSRGFVVSWEVYDTIKGLKDMKLALLNTSIATTEGAYVLRDIAPVQAIRLVQGNKDNLDSAIGHESTAQVMSTLLGVEVPANRQMFEQQKGQMALVFKLNGRPPEGKILTSEEIEKIGYKFQLLIRKKKND